MRSRIKTEMIGVSAVETLFYNYNHIETYISKGDKFLSWDGDIVIYKETGDRDNKKSNYETRIPVQVKGVTVDKINKDTFISYPIDKHDLENYLKDDGTIFFVVYIDNMNCERVYIASLTPDYLEHILDLKKHNKAYINIQLLHVTAGTIMEFCNSFIEMRRIQKRALKFNINEINFEKYNKINIRGIKHKGKYIYNEPYIYLSNSEDERVIINLKDTENLAFNFKNKDVKIGINDKVYFNEIGFDLMDSNVIDIGKNIRLRQDNQFINIKMKYDGLIYDIKDSIEFLLRVLNGEEFFIGSKKYDISLFLKENNFEKFKDELNSNLIYINDIISLLVKYDIKDNIDIKDILNHNDDLLHLLINHHFYGARIKKPLCNSNSIYMTIGKVSFISFQDKDNNLIPLLSEKLTITDNNGTKLPNYLVLDSKCLSSDYIGIDINNIMLNYKEFDVTEEYQGILNRFSLELLKAFDGKGYLNYLDLSLDIFEFLIKNEENNINSIINKYQTIKRMRGFTIKEIRDLSIMFEKEEDYQIKFAISILLDDLEDAKKYFSLFDTELKEYYKDLPIYNLYLDLNELN